MDQLQLQLLGRFAVRRNGQPVPHTDGLKLQELLSYLVLNRSHPHNRETLAGVLWGNGRADQARKYLRQTLWQLQSSLARESASGGDEVLTVDAGWVHLNLDAEMSVDVVELEHVFDRVRDVPGESFSTETANAVEAAVALYHGDLLEGWYQDWCLLERERLQVMFLIMLDKLMAHCEDRQEYEGGIAHGHRILAVDRARERTHRQMMRLHALAGDRTSALRQYERCHDALAEELDVEPSQRTNDLYDQIRADTFPAPGIVASVTDRAIALVDVAAHLKLLRMTLADIDRQLQHDIQAVDHLMVDRSCSAVQEQ